MCVAGSQADLAGHNGTSISKHHEPAHYLPTRCDGEERERADLVCRSQRLDG